MGRVVKIKQKILEIPIPTWVIKRVEAISVRNRWYLVNVYEPLFVGRFANENDFVAALHKGGITGLAQNNDDQDDSNGDENSNTDENPNKPPGISLDTTAAADKLQ